MRTVEIVFEPGRNVHMKISEIQKALKSYDANRGYLRLIKDEPHISELREFHATLGEKERHLSPKEILQVVTIGLGKRNNNGSASNQTFDMIFDFLGGKDIYTKLQAANLLDEDTVFIVTHMASQSSDPIKQLSNEFDTVKDIISSLSQTIRDNSKMGDLINFLAQNQQFNPDILTQLSLVEDSEITLLFDSLSIINKEKPELLNNKNIKSCIKFSLHPKAIQNLLYLLKATLDNKHLDQEMLVQLFNQYEGMCSLSIAKNSIDYLKKTGGSLESNLCFLLSNLDFDIDKIVLELEKLDLKNNDQTLLLLQAILNNYQYQDKILSGVRTLSPVNLTYINTIISYPKYAKQVADTIELLTNDEISSRFKTIYENQLKQAPKYSEELLKLLQVLQESGFLVKDNIIWALDNYEKSHEISLCIQYLQNSKLYKQKNIDRLIQYRGPADLLQQALNILSVCRLLNQKNFDSLLNSTLYYNSDQLQLLINNLNELKSMNNLHHASLSKILNNPSSLAWSNHFRHRSENESVDAYVDASSGLANFSIFPNSPDEEAPPQSWQRIFW